MKALKLLGVFLALSLSFVVSSFAQGGYTVPYMYPGPAYPGDCVQVQNFAQGTTVLKDSGSPCGSGNNSIVPNGSVNSYSLTNLDSPVNYQVPRSHLRVWKPYAGAQIVDTGGTVLNGKTAVQTMEIPSDATMIQVIYANLGTSSYTISAASAWGSSQWSASGGFATAMKGISLYDGSGNVLTTMAPLSFGNNGADVAPGPFSLNQTAPAAGTPLVTASSSSGSTLNFSTNITCPSQNSIIEIVASTGTLNPLYVPGTYVSSCVSSTGVVTLNQGLPLTVPSGTTVYFLPTGITVPGVSLVGAYNFVFSDWTPITTYPRIDGPVASSMTILQNGTPLAGTVSSVNTTANTITMSSNLGSTIAAGTALQACVAGTTSSAVTPDYTLQFANSGLATSIAPGMRVEQSATGIPNTTYHWLIQGGEYVSSVALGTNAVVTLTLPVNEAAGSGTTFSFIQTQTTSAQTASGSATLTLNSVANLAVGMSISAANNANVTALFTGTIQSISGNTVTMTTNALSTIAAATPLNFYFTLNINAAATPANAAVTVPTNPSYIQPGMAVVSGSAYPAATYTTQWGQNQEITTTLSPLTTISSGATVYACNPITTSASSAAGQAVINLVHTTWPNFLVSLRTNIGSANANYWLEGYTSYMGDWVNIPGNSLSSYATVCSTEGVLNVSGISNTSGGCSTNLNQDFVAYAVKFFSPQRGFNIAYVGDSHSSGYTTFYASESAGLRSAFALNRPGILPVMPINLGWAAATSMSFGSAAQQVIKTAQPGIALLQYTSASDNTGDLSAIASTQAVANSLAQQVLGYGGLPVITPNYQNQAYGCGTASTGWESQRLIGQSTLARDAAAGLPTIDLSQALNDPVNGNAWFNPAMTNDCIHANDIGTAAMANLLTPFLENYIRY